MWTLIQQEILMWNGFIDGAGGFGQIQTAGGAERRKPDAAVWPVSGFSFFTNCVAIVTWFPRSEGVVGCCYVFRLFFVCQ
jgi:hypothetical protein